MNCPCYMTCEFEFIFGYFDNFTSIFDSRVLLPDKASYSMQQRRYFSDCEGSFILAAASLQQMIVFTSNIREVNSHERKTISKLYKFLIINSRLKTRHSYSYIYDSTLLLVLCFWNICIDIFAWFQTNLIGIVITMLTWSTGIYTRTMQFIIRR